MKRSRSHRRRPERRARDASSVEGRCWHSPAPASTSFAPSVLEVFSSWDEVSQLDPVWLVLAALCQLTAFGFVWALQRLLLRTNAWFPVITSQLAGNATARLVPAGPAAGAAVQFRMLRVAGVGVAGATSGLAAAGVLQLVTTLALPLVALPGALFGATVPRSLLNAAWIGAALFVVLLVLIIVVLADDCVLRVTGRGVDVLRRRLGAHRQDRIDTATQWINERNSLRDGLGMAWRRAAVLTVGRAAFDFLTLLTALAAFGSEARVSLVLLAYAAASVLAMVPLTPGGLGFVEAGLTGTLTLAGLSPADAVSAALLYRLMSFWLPIPVGLGAAIVHRVYYRSTSQLATPG